MRANPDIYTGVSTAMQQTEQSLQTAMNQLSSGKRVTQPQDDPLAFAADVQSLASSASVDRFTKNADAVSASAQQADAALSNVVTALTQAISLGSQSGNGTLTDTQRQGLAQQAQTLFQNVVSLANTTSNGQAIFAGTASTTTPFVVDASATDGVSYVGTDSSNTAQVGESLSVTANIAGSRIFTSADGNVFGSLQKLVSAIQSGSSSDLANANSAISGAIAHIGLIRAQYGSTVNQLSAQENYLSQETVTLTSQQNSLVGVDLASAATNLTQAQTAQNAVLAMAAKILPTSLLNYLQN